MKISNDFIFVCNILVLQ